MRPYKNFGEHAYAVDPCKNLKNTGADTSN